MQGGRLLLYYHSYSIMSFNRYFIKQLKFASSLTCLQNVLLARIQYEHVSKASDLIVVFAGNIVLVERESQCDYRFAEQTGASIDWRCVTCLSMSLSESTPVAESSPFDFTGSMSTLYEPLADPAVDESSILEPLPAAEENDSSFTVTFQILDKLSQTKDKRLL